MRSFPNCLSCFVHILISCTFCYVGNTFLQIECLSPSKNVDSETPPMWGYEGVMRPGGGASWMDAMNPQEFMPLPSPPATEGLARGSCPWTRKLPAPDTAAGACISDASLQNCRKVSVVDKPQSVAFRRSSLDGLGHTRVNTRGEKRKSSG